MRSVARRSGVPAGEKIFPLRRNLLSAREAEKSASRAESAPLVPHGGTRGSRNAAHPQLFSFFLITEHCEKKYKKINIVILILHCKTLYYHNGASGIQSE